jgi:hypothetical protein
VGPAEACLQVVSNIQNNLLQQPAAGKNHTHSWMKGTFFKTSNKSTIEACVIVIVTSQSQNEFHQLRC